jgi:hypothetical protein
MDLIYLLFRHGLAILAAYLVSHGVADATSDGIIIGVIMLISATGWSWISKMLKFDAAFGLTPTTGEALRTALGSLVSQGITFASTYYSIDAHDPGALSIALINAAASRYGMHQQIAHQTPLAVATAIKALALGSMLSLSSCAGVLAFMGSPMGQAAIATAAALGKQLAKATETAVIAEIITKATTSVARLNAQGLNTDVAKEIVRQSELAGLQAVIDTAQIQYTGLTGARFIVPTSAKQPVLVSPNPTPTPTLHAPLTMSEPERLRIAVVPDYGVRVAALLAAQ